MLRCCCAKKDAEASREWADIGVVGEFCDEDADEVDSECLGESRERLPICTPSESVELLDCLPIPPVYD